MKEIDSNAWWRPQWPPSRPTAASGAGLKRLLPWLDPAAGVLPGECRARASALRLAEIYPDQAKAIERAHAGFRTLPHPSMADEMAANFSDPDLGAYSDKAALLDPVEALGCRHGPWSRLAPKGMSELKTFISKTSLHGDESAIRKRIQVLERDRSSRAGTMSASARLKVELVPRRNG
ncbi:MAG: hypothetical protein R3F43_09935 [bacterium]